MIYVTHNGQSEPLNNLQNVQRSEEVGGGLSLALTSFFSEMNPGHNLLVEESVITVKGEDFRVKQLREVRNRKEVTTVSTFFDLTGHYKEDIYGGTRTFDEFISFTLGGTGWTYQTVDVSGYKMIPNYGTDNVVKLVQELCKVYECEFQILPGNVLLFAKEIGPDRDFQYRYDHNIKALNKSVETSNLRTRVKGYGLDNVVVEYVSPNEGKFRRYDAEPVTEEELTGPELLEKLARELNDEPEINLELDAQDLSDRDIGEKVWLIYEPLDIEMNTRILSIDAIYRDGDWITDKVSIGNTKKKDLTNILTSTNVKIDENNKRTVSRFEQTNERITMEVERMDDSIASLEIQADNIQLSVKDIGDRVEHNEATISIHSNEIQSKVSQTDYNGNTIASLINQTATTIDIQASKINLIGAVEVLSDISGDLGIITTGNIDILQDAKIGAGLYLRGQGTITGVYFGQTQIMQDTTGYLNLLNRVRIGNFVEINGQLDLTGSNVTWGSNRPTAVWG